MDILLESGSLSSKPVGTTSMGSLKDLYLSFCDDLHLPANAYISQVLRETPSCRLVRPVFGFLRRSSPAWSVPLFNHAFSHVSLKLTGNQLLKKAIPLTDKDVLVLWRTLQNDLRVAGRLGLDAQSTVFRKHRTLINMSNVTFDMESHQFDIFYHLYIYICVCMCYNGAVRHLWHTQ